MINAIAIIRFIGTVIGTLFVVIVSLHWIGYIGEKDPKIKKEKKICLEKLFVCIIPGTASKNILRTYVHKDDYEATCSICLGNFSETPLKKIVQLECGQSHKFHMECF